MDIWTTEKELLTITQNLDVFLLKFWDYGSTPFSLEHKK